MSIFHDSALIGSGGGAAAYQINQSLRFNSADSAYLNRTPASAGNRKTWTWSGWVKRCTFGSVDNCLFSAYGNGTQSAGIYFSNDVQNDSLEVRFGPYSGGWQGYLVTTQVFRDPSAWYHIVFAADTTQATASDRLKLYVNGSQVTTFNSSAYPSQNADGFLNQAQEHQIGRLQGNTYYHDGYLAEVNFIDGTALTPSSFGETDTITGAWIPKKYSGSYGTNGFYLKFQSSGIGTDSSGNGNTWTANNFSTSGTGTDVMSDTPTNNWCTLNPLNYASASSNPPYDGNLVARVIPNTTGFSGSTGTVAVSSGKWYYEIAVTAASGMHGIVGSDWTNNQNSALWWNNARGYGMYGVTGNKFNNGSNSSYGSAFSNGDIVQVAFDLNNGKIWFGINNTWQASGDPVAGTNAAFTGLTGEFVPVGYAQAANAGDNTPATFNFGQRAFAYTPPTGYKALNTANLPEPTIKKGSKYFDTKLYTGTDASLTVNYDFSPDFVWIKSRSHASDHSLYDIVRGTNLQLRSNSTIAELNDTNGFNSFNSNGFTLGVDTGDNINAASRTYVAWAWDANGAGSSNTAGTITSTVSANASAGFSIVSYTGTGSALTVGHGLGVAPSFMIAKPRSFADEWVVWHKAFAMNEYIYLNRDYAKATTTNPNTFWNNTAPTSTVISIGANSNTNANGSTNILYAFSEVAGYSKFGSYTGNGSSDGPFVFCGFRPRWVMIKVYSGITDYWFMYDAVRDSYNLSYKFLRANLNNSENTDNTNASIDILSNGFKLRHTGINTNGSGNGYIFAAFSETAFKYANAR